MVTGSVPLRHRICGGSDYHKRVPTVNRAQYTSIFDDDNYKSALQYADPTQRRIYESEARAINEIQRKILAISQKEEPFDVFICYKETDNNGRRTPDSVLANDLYHQLTQEGFKVFFSRITLEDKLGSAYEPYIFAALNSARVMVVLGTKPEYFSAVWVKNEWSRYLSLIRQGQKKMLIPAYKDMDPYDLPEEFSHLQAQDMSKLGFMQDLIRGIQKITQTEAPMAVVETPVVATVGSSNVEALLERGNMALEDSEWDKAMGFFEDVLNNDARNAQAYLGETLAQEHCRTLDSFIRKRQREGQSVMGKTLELEPEEAHIAEIVEKYQIPDYCEEDTLRNLYDFDLSYDSKVFARKKQYADEEEYWRNHKQLSRAEKFATGAMANTLAAAKNALFTTLQDRIIKAEQVESETVTQLKEAYAAHIRQADEQAEALYQNAAAKREQEYQTWVEQANQESNIDELLTLACQFELLNGYRDSNAMAEHCKERRIAEMAKMIAEKEQNAKRKKKIAVFCTAVAAAALAAFLVATQIIVPNVKYNDAIALMESGNVIEAYEALIAMDGYKDSTVKASSLYDAYVLTKGQTVQVGDYLFFGSYEQDNDRSNGKEDIEWLVLKIEDGKALIISKYALDCKEYNEKGVYVTWETCSLRQWLNEDFFNAAFSGGEQTMIPTVTVSADKNPIYNTDPGNATQDKVFLLSIKEANEFFASDSDRQCVPTDYAVANGAYVHSDNGNCHWWLRSPGQMRRYAADVLPNGGVFEYGSDVDISFQAVRPAMWIDLSD